MFSWILNGYFSSVFKFCLYIKGCVHNIKTIFWWINGLQAHTERTEDRFRTAQSVVMFTAPPIAKFCTLRCHGISSSNEDQNISLFYHETGTYWTILIQTRQYLHQLSLNQLVDVHGNSYERHVNWSHQSNFVNLIFERKEKHEATAQISWGREDITDTQKRELRNTMSFVKHVWPREISFQSLGFMAITIRSLELGKACRIL
jgi:hypothetical protein